MRCLVRYLTRRANGGVAQREVPVDAGTIRLGRGTENEIYLPDLRVAYRHAEVTLRAGALSIEAVGEGVVSVNKNQVRQSIITPADEVDVGPYRVQALLPEPGSDADLILTIELITPIGDDVERLKAASRIGLIGVLPSKRFWAWTLFIAVLVVFLVVPMVAFFVEPVRAVTGKLPILSDRPWSSGDISGPHRFFGDQCNACHEKPFVQVRDEACAACHTHQTFHADPARFQIAGLNDVACESCHKEHNGLRPIVLREQSFCADCHKNLGAVAPGTQLANTTDFEHQHPEFRPLVVVDPAQRKAVRVSLDAKPLPRERSGLIYPHDKHLKKEGIRGPKGNTVLDCATCHKPEPGGGLMAPVTFEQHCQSCHQLKFDALAKQREVPHGRPEEVQAVIKDFYAGVALRGAGEDADEDVPPPVRRKVGARLSAAERGDALAWADQQADKTMQTVMGRSVCATCHTVTPPAQAASHAWEVLPVFITKVWMPKSRFKHAKHDVVECAACHKASTSSEASDILMPNLQSCRTCHGAQGTSAELVPSSCVMCHGFHMPDLPPMVPGHPASKTGRTAAK